MQTPQVSVHVLRHTVVCRTAKKAVVPHLEHIYRKKLNMIFTHT